MAQVLIQVVDTDDGGCDVIAEFVPPLPEPLSGVAPSPAQRVAAALMTIVEEQMRGK